MDFTKEVCSELARDDGYALVGGHLQVARGEFGDGVCDDHGRPFGRFVVLGRNDAEGTWVIAYAGRKVHHKFGVVVVDVGLERTVLDREECAEVTVESIVHICLVGGDYRAVGELNLRELPLSGQVAVEGQFAACGGGEYEHGEEGGEEGRAAP